MHARTQIKGGLGKAKEKAREERKGQDKRGWQVWVGVPSTQQGPDVDNSISEQVTGLT